MRDANLVNALRCASTAGGPMGGCKKFPFYKTEPVPEELVEKVNLKEYPSCEVDPMVLAAADRIETCLKCGNYTLSMRGACNGCRWRR